MKPIKAYYVRIKGKNGIGFGNANIFGEQPQEFILNYAKHENVNPSDVTIVSYAEASDIWSLMTGKFTKKKALNIGYKPEKLEGMGISNSSLIALKNAGIETLNQFSKLAELEIYRIRNLRIIDISLLGNLLKQYGYNVDWA